MTTDGHDVAMHTDLIHLYGRHLTRHCAQRTVATYMSVLSRAHTELPAGLPLAVHSELEDWLWAGDYAWSTRVVARAAVRGMLSWAVREGHLDRDESAALSPVRRQRRLPRPCTDEEVRRLLAHAGDPVYIYAVLAAYAGARAVEISRLDRDDVTPHAVRLWGKGDRERIVPTHPLVWRTVSALPPGPVAAGVDYNRVSQRTAHRCDQLRMQRVTLHRLRHWYATRTLERCGDLRVVQELLGHASPATTAGYTAVTPQAMSAAVADLPVWV